MKIQPLFDQVIVKPSKDGETKTPSGLVIVANNAAPVIGTVLGAGKQVIFYGTMVPMPVKVGDVVAYLRNAGTELSIDGESCRMLRVTDLVGKVNEE